MNEIIQGDCLEVLKGMQSESVDCSVTSPPYWALRDYKIEPIVWDGDSNCEHEWTDEIKKWHSDRGNGNVKEVFDASFQVNGTKHSFCSKCNAWRGQLGLEPTFELYIQHLCDIFDEVKRVLKKEGTCWVNLGDTFSGSGGSGGSGGDYNQGGMREGQPRFKQTKPNDLSPKSLCMIPYRFAIEMQNRGWTLRNILIWWKPNCMPSSAKDRFTVDFEPVFFFSKSKKYYFETQYEPHLSSSKKRMEAGFNEHQDFNWKERAKVKNYKENNM